MLIEFALMFVVAPLKVLFQAISETNCQYGQGKIVKILRGSQAKDVTTKDQNLAVFNTGQCRSSAWWGAFHRQLQPVWLAPEPKQSTSHKWTAFTLTPKATRVLSHNDQLLLADPMPPKV